MVNRSEIENERRAGLLRNRSNARNPAYFDKKKYVLFMWETNQNVDTRDN